MLRLAKPSFIARLKLAAPPRTRSAALRVCTLPGILSASTAAPAIGVASTTITGNGGSGGGARSAHGAAGGARSSSVHDSGSARSRTQSALIGRLPLFEEARDGSRPHAAHRLEFAGLLAVEQRAVLIEDRERRNPLGDRDVIARRDIQIPIHLADIDVHEHVVRLE